MARRGKPYSQRSASARHRIDRLITAQYGDSKAARQRALRDLREGKWTPFARDKERRIPERFRPAPRSRAELEEAYVNNMRNQVGEYLKFNPFRVRQRATELSDEDLIWGASATEDEIIERASADARATPKRVSPGFYH